MAIERHKEIEMICIHNELSWRKNKGYPKITHHNKD